MRIKDETKKEKKKKKPKKEKRGEEIRKKHNTCVSAWPSSNNDFLPNLDTIEAGGRAVYLPSRPKRFKT
jgi:hypothetical protein